ncbi:MAG: hypothetical protein KC713_03895 [Candidatus Omnitrophica bacterium]|nr:hypothetical protein [Candidatus Omnitrophota bacterium]
MKKIILTGFIVAVFSFLHPQSVKASYPVQVSLVTPIQIVNEVEGIKGVRLNLIYGYNDHVYGVDVGLVNKTDGMMKGVQVGLYNNNYETKGVQFGIINRTDWLDGLQFGLVNIHAEGKYGVLPIFNFSF